MVVRRKLAALALATLPFAACSAFSGSDTSPGGTDDAATTEAGALDGPTGDASAPAEPCVGTPPGTEIASLYVLGGQGPPVDGGPTPIFDNILRAPIRCDHSLGQFQPIATKLAVGTSLAQAALLDDGILLVGGDSNRTGAQYAKFAGPDLLAFGNSSAPSSSYRAIGASTKDLLLIAGDESRSSLVNLWRVVNGVPSTFGTPVAMPSAHARAAAAFVGDTVYLIGDGDFLSAAVHADGTMSPWTSLSPAYPDFDLSAAASGTHLYVVGGAGDPRALWTYSVDTLTDGGPEAGPRPASAQTKLPIDVGLAAVVVYRDTLYIIGTEFPPFNQTLIVSLVNGAVGTISMGPPLPAARYASSVIIHEP